MLADNLTKLLDALTETSVYVVEESTHRLLYFNERCRQLSCGRAVLGGDCRAAMPEACANCPLEALEAGGSSHTVCYDPRLETTVDVTADRFLWDGHRPAVLVSTTPHRLNFDEQQKQVEISQLATAARSAYQMLISVNLTQNTYHMLEYGRYPVRKPGDGGSFDSLIERELDTVHPDYQAEFIGKFSRDALTRAFSGGAGIVSMKVPHRGEDGVYHWSFTQVVRVESPHTDELIEITLSRNIDEERRLEEEALEKERRAKQILEDALQKAEKANRAKSEFLSKMSHDIRTPLNAIVGMTELARLHVGEAERLDGYLEQIAGAGAHLLGLVNEVLDVSKIESGTVELAEGEFDLRELAAAAAELVRLPLEGRGQSLTVELDPALHARVLGDAMRLKQVLVNILENASKYTEAGGSVRFTLEELKKSEPQVGTYRFVVEDNGVGMRPEYLAHIFEPFSRADDSRISKVPGTGLGMTIAKNLVEMMGGDIQVESEFGRGTRFQITLCLAKRAAAPPLAPEAITRAGASLSELRVLLVEDNELNRQIAAEMLGLLGVRVELAGDGQQAVEAVLGHPPGYYDMVFMDVQMPVLNGYEATRRIRGSGRAHGGELPIVAMTADAFAEDVRQARLAGMNGHLAKPISMEMLKSELSKCLAWKRRGGDGT